MTGRYPEIPTSTAEEQDRLREELLREVRKREAAEEANVMEVPPRKNKTGTKRVGATENNRHNW